MNTPGQFAALLLAGSSGLSIVPGSAMLTYASGRALDVADAPLTTSISSYDGSIAALGIGAGLLLTSGDAAPAARNTSSQYTVELDTSHLDADLTAAAKAGFPEAGMVQDATVLQFQFTVTDPALTGIQFDLVFGSDEYPEFSDTDFVDIGAVFVNGVNRALFNDKTDQPLSVIEKNLSDGGFRDNTDSAIPVEYDGVSVKLTIVAPVVAGVNTIKIAVGDTGDPSWDSGLFVSNLRAVAFSGTGLNKVIEGTGGAD
ncbi:MAG: choice-of-anchor L domain-containing protein, partial [Aquabacterium sp.]